MPQAGKRNPRLASFSGIFIGLSEGPAYITTSFSILQPILDKAKTAIEAVAKEGGYTYVLEASTLIVSNGPDLLPQVKTKLGIK